MPLLAMNHSATMFDNPEALASTTIVIKCGVRSGLGKKEYYAEDLFLPPLLNAFFLFIFCFVFPIFVIASLTHCLIMSLLCSLLNVFITSFIN